MHAGRTLPACLELSPSPKVDVCRVAERPRDISIRKDSVGETRALLVASRNVKRAGRVTFRDRALDAVLFPEQQPRVRYRTIGRGRCDWSVFGCSAPPFCVAPGKVVHASKLPVRTLPAGAMRIPSSPCAIRGLKAFGEASLQLFDGPLFQRAKTRRVGMVLHLWRARYVARSEEHTSELQSPV